MSFRIEVVFKPQVVLYVVDLGRLAQIAALESGVEHQAVVQVWHLELTPELRFELPLSQIRPLQSVVKLLFLVVMEVTFSRHPAKELLRNFLVLFAAKQNMVGGDLSWVCPVVLLHPLVPFDDLLRVVNENAAQVLNFIFFGH